MCNHNYRLDVLNNELYCLICGDIKEREIVEELPDLRRYKDISTNLASQQKRTIKIILYNIRFYSQDVYNQLLYLAQNYGKQNGRYLTTYRLFLLVYKYLKENKIKRVKMLLEISKEYGNNTHFRLYKYIYRTPKKEYTKAPV